MAINFARMQRLTNEQITSFGCGPPHENETSISVQLEYTIPWTNREKTVSRKSVFSFWDLIPFLTIRRHCSQYSTNLLRYFTTHKSPIVDRSVCSRKFNGRTCLIGSTNWQRLFLRLEICSLLNLECPINKKATLIQQSILIDMIYIFSTVER